MKTVLLRLEGPLQSWGTRSRFGRRDTESEPSKSGVLGVVGAALGMPRTDDARLARLSEAVMGVRVDREPTRMTDYHTVGDGTFRGAEYQVHGVKEGAVLTHRDYLQDASFLVALGFDDHALAVEVDAALRAPVWPLFLGRRSCPPSLPVHVPGGVLDASPEAALQAALYPAHALRQDDEGRTPPLRLVLECAPSHGDAQPRQDQPLSFRPSHRHYARRFVRTAWLPAVEVRLLPLEAPCISLVAS
ncbi:MAG: type I-E CRISPR-associated protein Cas5/CasD [Deltaproteobacteria bacterium]|nr:type I-E CRISPR-associated protein Cas5/CasD [Deltaproteobacteria bacterium]